MQATLGFLQHYAPDATSLRALIAALAAAARTQIGDLWDRLAGARSSDELALFDAHLRRDVGLGEFGAPDLPGVRFQR